MRKTLIAAGIAFCAMASAANADTTLVLFRHGEKPELGLGQINCQGFNRALALPSVLLAKFGKPDALFAPNPSVGTSDHGRIYSYIRPLATIEPTAIRLGMPVNVEWGYKDIQQLEQTLVEYKNQLVFVAWEHRQLVRLARNILKHQGEDKSQVPEWRSDDFDSLYVLSLPESGKATFRIEHQGLNGQSTECPGQTN